MANNTTVGVRKSQFNAATSISGSATFDFVENRTNKKITYTALLPLLGATGSMAQVGDPTGTPVLDIQGSVNGIRNLVEGDGISLGITGLNGLEISTSFTFDQSGEALVSDPASQAPDFKSLIGGSGVDLASDDDAITISVDGSDLYPNNQVIVNNAADLPDAVSGVRTLAANTQYLIGDVVSIATDRLVFSSGTVVQGLGGASLLSSDTTSALFSGVDAGQVSIIDLTISVPNGDLFNVVDTVQGTSSILMSNSSVVACDGVGTIGNVFAVDLSTVAFLSINKGLEFLPGTSSIISLRTVVMTTASATCKFFDLGTSVSPAVGFRDVVFTGVVGTIGISGLSNNGNILTGSIAVVDSCEFLGGITPLENITIDDYRWNFSGNSGLADTMPDALLALTGNATNTVIAASSTPVLVAGTWTVVDSSHLTCTGAGRATYDGERDIKAPIDVVITLEPVSGSNKDLAVCIAVNGVAISQTSMVARVDSGNPNVISTVWQRTLSQDDYIEVFVENRTDATNILVSDAILRVL